MVCYNSQKIRRVVNSEVIHTKKIHTKKFFYVKKEFTGSMIDTFPSIVKKEEVMYSVMYQFKKWGGNVAVNKSFIKSNMRDFK